MKDNLVSPITIKTIISKSVDNNNIPRIEISGSISQVNLMINPMILRFLADLEEHIFKIIPNVLNIQSKSYSIDIDNELEKIEEKKPEIISLAIIFVLESLSLTIKEINSSICDISITHINTAVEIDPNSNILINFVIRDFRIEDKRQKADFVDIIYNPYDESNRALIKLKMKIDPALSLTDIGISVADLRIVMCPNFFLMILDFLKNNLDALKLPQIKLNKRAGVYYKESNNNTRVSILCPNIEL